VKWIDQVLELALERKPEPLSDKPDVAPVPAVEQATAPAIKH
jgi:ATP-dependent Lon protease